MKPIIHNVSETTTHTHTRRFKSFLTDEQVSKHLRGLEAQDKLHRNAKSMRNETGGKSKKTKGMNKKLALAKPATMRDFIIQRANNIGATVVLVNPNFTSQIEFGVLHEPKKIPLDVREWISEFTGRLIERDYNAAWNILFWGLYPEYHYLVSTGESAKYLSRTN